MASSVMVLARRAMWSGVRLPRGTEDFQWTIRVCALCCCAAAVALSVMLLLPTVRVRGRPLWARCPVSLWRWTIFVLLVLLRAANGLSTTSTYPAPPPPPPRFPSCSCGAASPPEDLAVGTSKGICGWC